MTRNVTGFLFILEIKMTIRWRVEECGGGGGVEGVLDEWSGLLFYSDKETASVCKKTHETG